MSTAPLRRSNRVAASKRTAEEVDSSSSSSKSAATKLQPVVKKAKTAAAAPAAADAAPKLTVGDKLPDVTLQNEAGDDVNLSQLAQDGAPIIIFAYPKASTPGCTKQACGFRDRLPALDALDKKVRVFGLSADSVAAQLRFKEKQALTYPLLSDPEFKLLGPLGAKKSAKGGVIRSHWIVEDGKISVASVQVSPADSFTKATEYFTKQEGAEAPKEEATDVVAVEPAAEAEPVATEPAAEPAAEPETEPKAESETAAEPVATETAAVTEEAEGASKEDAETAPAEEPKEDGEKPAEESK